jgi:hypothetical protein
VLFFCQIAPATEVILQAGDLIGFTQTGTGTVAVNYVSPSKGYRYEYKPADGSVPAAGDQVTKSLLAATDMFSYNIVIGRYRRIVCFLASCFVLSILCIYWLSWKLIADSTRPSPLVTKHTKWNNNI